MSGTYPQTPLWRQARALSFAVARRKDKRPIAHKLIETIKQAMQGGAINGR